MARAAMPLKCTSESEPSGGELASLSQASLTSAVGLTVARASLLRTLEARRRSSS
jgi:hypothetical protein